MIIIIILSFWVSKSKNKNIDNQGNENYAMIGLSIQKKKKKKKKTIITQLPSMFGFFKLKEKDHSRRKTSKKNVYMRNEYN